MNHSVISPLNASSFSLRHHPVTSSSFIISLCALSLHVLNISSLPYALFIADDFGIKDTFSSSQLVSCWTSDSFTINNMKNDERKMIEKKDR